MGKNSFNGGGTIVHAGSGFFSHKGGPGRRRKPVDGADRPGDAKPGSICDFGPIKRKNTRVVEFALKTVRSKTTKKPDEKYLRSRCKSLINRTIKLAKQKDVEIASLRIALARAELAKQSVGAALNFAHNIDLDGGQLEDALRKLNGLLKRVSATASSNAQKSKNKGRRILPKGKRAVP